jgi:hypothetical protein
MNGSAAACPSVYAVGDVTGPAQPDPVAIGEGRAQSPRPYSTTTRSRWIMRGRADRRCSATRRSARSGLTEEAGRSQRTAMTSILLSARLPADEEPLSGARNARLMKMDRRFQDRPGARLPHARGRRRRNRPGPRGRGSSLRHKRDVSTRPSASTRAPPRNSLQCAKRRYARRSRRRSKGREIPCGREFSRSGAGVCRFLSILGRDLGLVSLGYEQGNRRAPIQRRVQRPSRELMPRIRGAFFGYRRA